MPRKAARSPGDVETGHGGELDGHEETKFARCEFPIDGINAGMARANEDLSCFGRGTLELHGFERPSVRPVRHPAQVMAPSGSVFDGKTSMQAAMGMSSFLQ